jgi:hypothetical protein
MQDTYWSEPQEASYEQRRSLYLQYCAAHSLGGRDGFFSQIARLELGQQAVDEDPIREAIKIVDKRMDCSDFSVGGLLRILYLYRDSPLISQELIAEIKACLLRFKYWWDEPVIDWCCYHTENHQIVYHSDELLAGQLFKERIFQNDGKDGRYHIEHASHLIQHWFDFRVKFGFSEWLSNNYFEVDLLGLVNLYDFAENDEIRNRAKTLIDIIMFEMALHTYRGVFGCTHGRAYAGRIKGGRLEHSASTAKLMFGMGLFNKPNALGAIPLATSSYRCPPIIEAIANDLHKPILCKERHSLNVEDAPRYGLSYDSIEDGLLFWGMGEHLHPKVFQLSKRISELYGVNRSVDYDKQYKEMFQPQIEKYGRIIDPYVTRTSGLIEVHIQTYRTPYYLLSCAQDYRAGKPGYQQHIWQATLGIDAVVFTNHPGSENEVSRPNYWAGNSVMPRAAQHKNVVICVYHISPKHEFPFTHAYFPRDAFDAVVERGKWLCACKEDGFIALYTQHPYCWMQDREILVHGTDNIWVCEMGDCEQWGDFFRFVQAVTNAKIHCEGLRVEYESPSLGSVSFGWEGSLQVAGQLVQLHNYERFDNPYCQCAFLAPRVVIQRKGEELVLDFEQNENR